jgi:hypothetical protein
MVTLSDGAGVHHNSILNLVSGDGYQAPLPSFENIPPVENDGEEHEIDGPPFDEEESYESRETTGEAFDDHDTTLGNSNGSNTVPGSPGVSPRETDDEEDVSFTNQPAGGKRRKSKRRTKRKLKWDNKATIAVVATTVAFDKTLPPTDLTDPSGGKKTKRRKSKSRKKPRSLKKRVR